jgi:hypothetical protein
MKVWLDDDLDKPDMPNRHTPEGWVGVKTAQEAIDLLKTGEVDEIDLDHDLGDEILTGNGYDVLLYIEKALVSQGFVPPKINIHTANPSAREKMERAVDQIERLFDRLYR